MDDDFNELIDFDFKKRLERSYYRRKNDVIRYDHLNKKVYVSYLLMPYDVKNIYYSNRLNALKLVLDGREIAYQLHETNNFHYEKRIRLLKELNI